MKTAVYTSTWYEKLVACIGAEPTRKLVAKFGGTSIPVPRVNVFLVNQRDIMITQDYLTGKYNQRELAEKWTLSVPTIRKIIKNTLDDTTLREHFDA